MGGLGLVGSRELRARGPCQIQPPLASGLLKMPVISSSGCDSVTLRGSKLPQKLLGTRFTFFRLKLLIINSLPSLLPSFLSGLSYFEGQTLPLSSGSLSASQYRRGKGQSRCLLPTEGLQAAGPVRAVTYVADEDADTQRGMGSCLWASCLVMGL